MKSKFLQKNERTDFVVSTACSVILSHYHCYIVILFRSTLNKLKDRMQDKPSRFVGFRLNNARRSDWASGLRNWGMPSFALSHTHTMNNARRSDWASGLRNWGMPSFALSHTHTQWTTHAEVTKLQDWETEACLALPCHTCTNVSRTYVSIAHYTMRVSWKTSTMCVRWDVMNDSLENHCHCVFTVLSLKRQRPSQHLKLYTTTSASISLTTQLKN